MNRKLILPCLVLIGTTLACSVQINATNPPPPTDTSTPQIIILSTDTPPEPTQTATQEPTANPGFSLEDLQNATVYAPYYGRTVTLHAGAYSEGSGADLYTVQMLDVFAFGDLNGDGKDDAAIILAENGGGTGVFESLAVFIDLNGSPHQVDQLQLGDRILVNTAEISLDVIHLEMTVHAPNDPLCCPSQQEVQSFWLLGNDLWLMRVTSGQTGVERAINIAYPANWADLVNPFTVNGSVPISPFENTLGVGIYLTDRTVINESSLMVSSDGMGTPGTFSQSFNLANAGITGLVVIQFKDLSAADGSILALDSMVINLH
jgi:hypothetical protein